MTATTERILGAVGKTIGWILVLAVLVGSGAILGAALRAFLLVFRETN